MRYNCRDCDWELEFYGKEITKVLEHERKHKNGKQSVSKKDKKVR